MDIGLAKWNRTLVRLPRVRAQRVSAGSARGRPRHGQRWTTASSRAAEAGGRTAFFLPESAARGGGAARAAMVPGTSRYALVIEAAHEAA
jgi:hypothetical protein